MSNFSIDSLDKLDKMNYLKFMSKVEKRGSVRTDMSPCWTHTMSKSSSGYGQITFQGVHWDLHRYSYYIHNGCPSLISKDHVRHKCSGNFDCCNPDHLMIGTAKENSNDYWSSTTAKQKKSEKISTVNLEPCHNCIDSHKACTGGTICDRCVELNLECIHKEYKLPSGAFKSGESKGENNLNAKLNWEKVRAIRKKIAEGLPYGGLKKLAKEYDIEYVTIQKIKSGALWVE